MFLFRLKQEFAENARLLALYWLCLAMALWSHFTWCFGSHDAYNRSSAQEAIGNFSLLGLCGINLMIVATMFKRDDLKCPQDFCATRPIRSLPLYGAKLTFTWLMLALPVGLAIAVTGMVAGHGIVSIWYGLEMTAWLGFTCSLLALSCMAYPGGSRSFIIAMVFVAALLTTVFLINIPVFEPWIHPLIADPQTITGNLFLALGILSVAMVWLCHRQFRDKHSNSQPWWFAVVGIACVLFVSFAPVPYQVKDQVKDIVTVLPKATEASLVEYDISHGWERGTSFVTGGIHIETGLATSMDEMLIHRSQVLNTVDFNEPWFQIEGSAVVGYSHEGRAKLRLSYTVYEDVPDRYQGSRSSTGSDDLAKSIAELPKRKVRIVDTVILDRQQYEEVHRSPLSKAFAIHHNNLKIDYLPGTSDGGRDHIINLKSYTPSLANSNKLSVYEQFRFNIEHPDIDKHMSVDDFGGGGGGSRSIFGRAITLERKLSSHGVLSSRFCYDLEKEEQQLIVDEWQDKAVLVVEAAKNMERIEIPIDVKIEIPDPEALRQLLKEGKL